MKHGSLFSGVGGFDLAAEWMGWENVFHCEWNEFGQRILKHYWPEAISYADITKTDFTIHRGSIDIVTGGFPCQPYSVAGKRKGTEDDRHLWPEMLRAIREIQPTYVVGENVGGLVNWSDGLVFEQVQADLENEGYEVQAVILPACAVNAPHRRDRIWFIAYSSGNGHKLRGFKEDRSTESQSEIIGEKRERIWADNRGISEQGIITNSESNGDRGGLSRVESENDCFGESKEYRKDNVQFGNDGKIRDAANSNPPGLQIRVPGKLTSVQGQASESKRREFTRAFTERNGWEEFPTQPPVCNGDDGLSSRLDGITFSKWRTESIKGGGNAIVPQLAYQIFKAIENS